MLKSPSLAVGLILATMFAVAFATGAIASPPKPPPPERWVTCEVFDGQGIPAGWEPFGIRSEVEGIARAGYGEIRTTSWVVCRRRVR